MQKQSIDNNSTLRIQTLFNPKNKNKMKRAVLISTLSLWSVCLSNAYCSSFREHTAIVVPDVLYVIPKRIPYPNLGISAGLFEQSKSYLSPAKTSKEKFPTHLQYPCVLIDEKFSRKLRMKRNIISFRKKTRVYHSTLLKPRIIRLKIPP